MRSIFLKLFVLLLIFFVILSCCYTKEEKLSMAKFFNDMGIVGEKIDNKTYINIISDNALQFVFNENASKFIVYDTRVMNDPLYCNFYIRVLYNKNCNSQIYDKLSSRTIVYEFPLGINHEWKNGIQWFYVSPANFFNAEAGDFKVDKNNNKHWYVHYEGSWHKWDLSNVTKDIIQWKVYEEWEEYKKYYMDNETKGVY